MRSAIAVVVGLAVLAGVPALAQETTTGSIQGRVVDTQGLPVPGATVTITSAQGTKTFTTDAEGRYFAPFLTPGVHRVKAELQGFRPIEQQNVNVGLGQRVELNRHHAGGRRDGDGGGVGDGAHHRRDQHHDRREHRHRAAGPGARSAPRQRHALPRARREQQRHGRPGEPVGLGRQRPREPVHHRRREHHRRRGTARSGSYSIVFGSLGNGTPFDFIQEVQVKTGGYEAEFGQATGGVVNVVTKSGANELPRQRLRVRAARPARRRPSRRSSRRAAPMRSTSRARG